MIFSKLEKIRKIMSSAFIYTISYILFVWGITYPPTEFVSAGLTISELCSSWLGNEYEAFVQYHIKRSIVTLFVHSLLPFGYIVGLTLLGHLDYVQLLLGTEHSLWLTLSLCALVGPICSLRKIIIWSRGNFAKHPIAEGLAIYCNERGTWLDIASDVNREYRSFEKLQIRTNNTTKIVITNTWLIKVSNYKLNIASQINSVLVAYNVNSYSSTPSPDASVHYVKYRVVVRQPGGQNFTIRINASDVENLLGKISMPARTLSSVQVPKTLVEFAIDEVKQRVSRNPIYPYDQEPEKCAVCMQATANVKIMRHCPDIPEIDGVPACGNCHCPPMFCIDCVAKWFVSSSSQKKNKNGSDLKSSCPHCRAVFCLTDLHYILILTPNPEDNKETPSQHDETEITDLME